MTEIKHSIKDKRLKGRITLAANGEATLRLRFTHPMESGHRKDANGQTIAPYYINQVKCLVNGKLSFHTEWGPGVSENPPLFFKLKDIKPSDTFMISWQDNLDHHEHLELTLQESK